MVTYAVALCLTLILLFFIHHNRILLNLRQLNWASYCWHSSIVGLEVGFLLVYRAGGTCIAPGVGQCVHRFCLCRLLY